MDAFAKGELADQIATQNGWARPKVMNLIDALKGDRRLIDVVVERARNARADDDELAKFVAEIQKERR